MARQRFACPVCGRETTEVARLVADDSRSQEAAAGAMSDEPLSAAPFCEDGHPPTPMEAT